MAPQRNNLLGLNRVELEEFMASLGEPRYRGAQLFRWIYLRGAGSFDAMTDLSLGLRSALAERAELCSLTTVTRQTSAADGTTKFLFALDDGLRIESVLIPPSTAFRGEGAGSEDEQRRLTLCVSTQVGCMLDCGFCLTGTMGLFVGCSVGSVVDVGAGGAEVDVAVGGIGINPKLFPVRK